MSGITAREDVFLAALRRIQRKTKRMRRKNPHRHLAKRHRRRLRARRLDARLRAGDFDAASPEQLAAIKKMIRAATLGKATPAKRSPLVGRFLSILSRNPRARSH